ncbi:WhiB family transcriptional regulator [Janibacter indicus]|uniref:WhiB family transcriptional regulator n=1 Tax=Janibacter indicus TaxID=857417 RepID=A0A7L9J559_9MICO|nr:WhiB family transcriptional regulator [Janibacter indicus]QOK24145.1 WhiB family transcriptional regulator [Janibacter indicus]
MSARDALDRALLDLAADGRRPRCGEPADHLLWTSEDTDERARAAALCVGCPVLQECALAAEEEAELFVWAGVDRGARPKTPKGRKRA